MNFDDIWDKIKTYAYELFILLLVVFTLWLALKTTISSRSDDINGTPNTYEFGR